MTVALDDLWRVLAIAGRDSSGFLHGQLTTDVKGQAGDEARFTAYLSPKGRVIAHGVLVPLADGWYLLTHPSLADALAERLRRYVLRADVTIAIEARARVMGEPGGAAELAASPAFTLRDATPDRLAIAWPGGRTLLVQRPPEAEGAADEATPSAAATASWLAEDIAHGVPHVTAATTERHVAQALGLEALAAISYRKGCYPGQEVVARAHYLGRVKRHLERLTGPSVPPPGTALRQAGAAVGEVLIAAPSERGGASVLAVLQGDLPGAAVEDEAGHIYDRAPLVSPAPAAYSPS